MALSNLSAKEMLGLSGAWLDPERSRKTLAGSRRTMHLLDDLQQAHDALQRESGGAPAQPSQELTALLAQEVELDGTHDSKARGINLVLTGLAELADTPEHRETVAALSRLLFPEGMAFINSSYSAEVGNVEATEKRLSADPQAQAALKKVSTPWGSKLLDEAHAWFEAGHGLGALEAKRLHIEQPASPAGNARVRARGRWLSIVNTMLSTIALDGAVDPALERDVLTPIREAEVRADARTSRRKKPAEGGS